MITRETIINHIMTMKNGNEKTTPQPDAAREALKFYNQLLPWMALNQGVKEAMQ